MREGVFDIHADYDHRYYLYRQYFLPLDKELPLGDAIDAAYLEYCVDPREMPFPYFAEGSHLVIYDDTSMDRATLPRIWKQGLISAGVQVLGMDLNNPTYAVYSAVYYDTITCAYMLRVCSPVKSFQLHFKDPIQDCYIRMCQI